MRRAVNTVRPGLPLSLLQACAPPLAGLDIHVDDRSWRRHPTRGTVAQAGDGLSDLAAPLQLRTLSSGLDDWVVDIDSPTFPGSQMGKTQALGEAWQIADATDMVDSGRSGHGGWWMCWTWWTADGGRSGCVGLGGWEW